MYLSFGAVGLRKSIDFPSSVAVDKLEPVCIEVDPEELLVQFDEADQLGIEAHVYGLFIFLPGDIGDHREFNFFPLVDFVPVRH